MCTFDLVTFWRGRKRAVHSRILRPHYERLIGPIPEGHQLHHLCHDPACSNVGHLVPMTRAQHIIEHRYRELWRGFNETALEPKV